VLALQAPALDADGLVIISLDANQARRVASLARKPGQDFQLASQRGDSNIGEVPSSFADRRERMHALDLKMQAFLLVKEVTSHALSGTGPYRMEGFRNKLWRLGHRIDVGKG
jgi:hypothetical protein